MIKYQRFRRESMTWRVSQFRDLCDLSNITELPYGCILHVLDNFAGDGKVDWGPRSNNHFINMNRFKLFMHNVATYPSSTKPTDVVPWNKEKMILTNGGVMGGLMTYMRSMMPRVRFVSDMEDLPLRPSTMSVINYNPLFRARILGVRKKIRFFNFLLAQLINRIMEAPDRQHFIHIPLENFTYEKKDFIRIFRKFDKISTLFPERSSYLLLAHFYGILAKKTTLARRGEVDTTELEDGDEVEGAEEMLDVKFSSEEIIAAMEDEMSPAKFMTNISFSALSNPSIALEALREGANPYNFSIFEFIPTQMYEKINFMFTVGTHYVCYNLRDMKEINGNANVGILKIINQINNLIRTSDGGALNDTTDEAPVAPEAVTTIDDAKIDKGNIIDFTKPMSHADKIDAAEVDLLELDDVTPILKRMPEATVKQKEYTVKLSKAYKHLEIGEVTFDKLLGNVADDTINAPPVITSAVKTGSLKERATESSSSMLNKVYVEKQMLRDIAAVCTSFNKQGMFLTGFDENKTNDELNAWTTYKASFEDTNHKKHHITIPIPRLDKYGRTKINGTIKAMKLQRVAKPICKVSDTRITLNSNLNKALIERNANMARSFIDWFSRKAIHKIEKSGYKLTPIYGACRYPLKAVPFVITELGKKYKALEFKDGKLVLDYEHRFTYADKKMATDAEAAELNNGVWIGYKGNLQLFATVEGLITAKNLDTEEEEFCGAFGDFIEWLTNIHVVEPVEYVECTYVSKTVPLIHMLAYRYGLTNMLKYCSVDYQVYEKNQRVDTRPSDIVIRFKDRKLIISRTPRNNALLFGGLTAYDFDDVYLEDMDDKDVYYTMLDQLKVSLNFIKGIDTFFEMFIDPITKSILREMKEPTDMRDLLIHAVTLLTTSDHLESANEANFRYRGVEQITGAVYNEMARAFSTFKNRSVGASNKFSLSEFAIKQRILQDQNMENISTINPIEDIKSYSVFTNAGLGGRGSDTFLTRDRRYTKDSLGIVSEATPDNSKTGMIAYLPANPVLCDSRGMSDRIPIEELEPENILSFSSLLMPQVDHDDGKRANFVSIQASAAVPINGAELSRVRTGFEELVAHRTRPPFAYPAEDDGVIQALDAAAGTMIIKYKNGTKVSVDFGEQYSNNSSNGFYVNQDVVVNDFKRGDTFKRGDILTYNKQFFQADPYSKNTVSYKLGIQAKVALMDNGGTIEDASILTKPLCDRMIFNPVHLIEVVLTNDTNIRSYAQIGEEVTSTDSILVWDESAYDGGADDDPELVAMLSKLNSTSKKAGHTGTVVKIEALYKSPLSTMTPSMQKLIKYAVAKKNMQAALSSGCINEDDHLKSTPLTATTKLGTILLEPETVILRFYIKQFKGMSPGDKLFFDSSLKSVCSQVLDEPIMTEDGESVEACTSCRGILARLISSPFTVGIANSCLAKCEQDCLAIWDS